MATRNTVEFDGDETTVIIAGESFFLTRKGSVWHVGRDGWFEGFLSARVAAGTFRQVVETAMLEHEAARRQELRRREQVCRCGECRWEDYEPAFVPGRVKLVEADYLPC